MEGAGGEGAAVRPLCSCMARPHPRPGLQATAAPPPPWAQLIGRQGPLRSLRLQPLPAHLPKGRQLQVPLGQLQLRGREFEGDPLGALNLRREWAGTEGG
jgi:hypothetical protein